MGIASVNNAHKKTGYAKLMEGKSNEKSTVYRPPATEILWTVDCRPLTFIVTNARIEDCYIKLHTYASHETRDARAQLRRYG